MIDANGLAERLTGAVEEPTDRSRAAAVKAHLPIAPLAVAVRAAGGPRRVGLTGKLMQAWARAYAAGWISEYQADQIACRLGMHPCQVWGEAWWQPPAPPRRRPTLPTGLLTVDQAAAVLGCSIDHVLRLPPVRRATRAACARPVGVPGDSRGGAGTPMEGTGGVGRRRCEGVPSATTGRAPLCRCPPGAYHASGDHRDRRRGGEMPRTVAVVAVIATAAVLTGCSGSSKPATTAASTPATGPTVTAASTPASSAPAPPPPNLQTQLLTLSDLPTGWSLDNSSDSSDAGTTPACFQSADSAKSNAKASADASYVGDSSGLPDLEESLGYFTGTGAASAFAQMTKVLAGCGQINLTSDGQKFTGDIGQMSFPTLGDQSSAYQLKLSTTTDQLTVSVAFDVLAIHVGDEAMMIEYGDLGTPDVDQLQQLAQRAVDKITGRSTVASAPASSAAPAAAADVQIQSCAVDADLSTGEAKGVVTNHSSKTSDYDIEIAFLDPSGKRLDTGADFVDKLPPNGQANFDAGGTESIPSDTKISCSVLSVDRTASSD